MRRKAAKAPDAGTTIDVKDFGPIRRGSIEILPMTVLLGSNNSGKSYASLLIRSILGDGRVWGTRWAFKKHAPVQKPITSGNMSAKKRVDKATDKFIQNLRAEILPSMRRTFSDNLASLIRIDADKCTVKIQTKLMTVHVNISNKSSTCRISSVQRPNVKLTRENRKLRYSMGGGSTTIDSKPDRKLADAALLQSVHRHFRPHEVFYFPAGRSGILQGHKAISASIVRHARYGLQEAEVPKLPGVVADFVGDVIEMPTKRGPFYGIASDLEREILQGEIKMEHGHPASDIKYVHRQREIPIHLASSTVSEMAPFILYLKHTVSEKSTLIIEEPEAHLHPHDQAIFAKCLTRLVRRGLKIVLATHSPFVVDQIINMVQAGNIAKSGQANANAFFGKNGWMANLGLKQDDYLEAKEVAAYEFVPSPSGYEIDRLDVEADDGMQVKGFEKETDRLYRQSLALQDRMDNGP